MGRLGRREILLLSIPTRVLTNEMQESSSASLTAKERKEAQSPRSEEEIAKAKAAAVEMLVESQRDENRAKMKKKRAEKTIAELDEELRLKLEGISGEGGDAGVEYEGGKAVGLKRGVRENMFRVI